MIGQLKHQLNQRYLNWIKRRAPQSDEILLEQRRIFIFPSRSALGFFALIALMLVAAINYQNNMIFVLCFWLLAVFVVVILQTFANVASLQVKLKPPKPVFAGELVGVQLDFRATKRLAHRALALNFKASELRQLDLYPQQADVIYTDVTAQQASKVGLALLASERGEQVLPPILLQSVYPLGLLNCWSWLRFASSVLVYPRPVEPVVQPALWQSDKGESEALVAGDEEFMQARLYQAGDEIKHLDWFKLAKGQGLHTKQFNAHQSEQKVLDWDLFSGVDTELRLSYLAYMARHYHHQQLSYGLKIPGSEIALNSGEVHYHKVLKALALYRAQPSGENKLKAKRAWWQRRKNQQDETLGVGQ